MNFKIESAFIICRMQIYQRYSERERRFNRKTFSRKNGWIEPLAVPQIGNKKRRFGKLSEEKLVKGKLI